MPTTYTNSSEHRDFTITVHRTPQSVRIGSSMSTVSCVEVNGQDVIIVGEQHGNDASMYLCERIYRSFEPDLFAIEARNEQSYIPVGAMMFAFKQAELNESPAFFIDTGIERSNYDDYGEVNPISNTFTYEVDSAGDVDPRAISNARQAVYELFGEDEFYDMYTKRERDMAGRIRWITENYDGTLLVACGAFHVEALAKRLEDENSIFYLESGGERIKENQ